jgi:hypothetical protein
MADSIVPGLGRATFGSFPLYVWVAEISGRDPKYTLARTFLRFKRDYAQANSKGSRGIYAVYLLDAEKLYEVKDGKDRYFCTVIDWEIQRLTLDDAKIWLSNIEEAQNE